MPSKDHDTPTTPAIYGPTTDIPWSEGKVRKLLLLVAPNHSKGLNNVNKIALQFENKGFADERSNLGLLQSAQGERWGDPLVRGVTLRPWRAQREIQQPPIELKVLDVSMGKINIGHNGVSLIIIFYVRTHWLYATSSLGAFVVNENRSFPNTAEAPRNPVTLTNVPSFHSATYDMYI
ncbi:hypothetical protein B0H13DRAFT_1873381 [Mycena leptocephala]|nr:hypothetical protein B0H13DRAFT_1873381 [Mycena leptocephala]